MEGELTCKTGLKPEIISEEVFEREISLCKKLSKEGGGGCGWGRCETCGVLPLVHKLYKGELLTKAEDIEKIREEYLN